MSIVIRILSEEEQLRLAVEQGQIPRYLYKYCAVDNALKTLSNHSIWFSTFDRFNDPFDCAMQVRQRYTKQDWEQYLNSQGVGLEIRDKIIANVMAHPDDGIKIIKESLEDVKKTIGIFCMSDRYDNLLLWANYADQHRGVCLEFDVLADPLSFYIPRKVSYDNSFPVVDFLHDQDGAVNALSHKSKDWEIEGEYRVVKHGLTGLKEIKPEALTKIILGLRCSNTDEEKIRNLLNPAVYTKAQLLKAISKTDEYKIEIVL